MQLDSQRARRRRRLWRASIRSLTARVQHLGLQILVVDRRKLTRPKHSPRDDVTGDGYRRSPSGPTDHETAGETLLGGHPSVVRVVGRRQVREDERPCTRLLGHGADLFDRGVRVEEVLDEAFLFRAVGGSP